MARRLPPSHEALADALRRYHEATAPQSGSEPRLLPYNDTVRFVATEFSTNAQTARKWIEAARDDRALFQMRTSEYGTVGVLIPDPRLTDGVAWGALSEAGFGDSSTNYVRVDEHGRWVSSSIKDRRKRAKEGVWLATSEVLEHLVASERQSLLDRQVEREAERVLTDATIQHVHVDAIDLIRGLLASAGLLREQTAEDRKRGTTDFSVHVSPAFTQPGRQTSVDITLNGEDIDRFAEALRALGIQPQRPD